MINGIPKSEFQLEKCLGEEDPSSPFPFFLTSKDLHIVIENVGVSSVIWGVNLVNEKLVMSHIFHVDDAILLVEYGSSNMRVPLIL